MSMGIKAHDLEPALVMVVEDELGVADLRNVVSWRILGKLDGQLVVNGTASAVVDSVNHSKATLTRPWVSGETDQVGEMRVEAEAMWPGNRPQTFPCESYEVVRIKPDLG